MTLAQQEDERAVRQLFQELMAHAVGSILDSGRTTPKGERLSSQTLVAVKQQAQWRFRTFHNTRVRPIGGGLRNLLAWVVADLAWRLLGKQTIEEP